MGQLAEALKVPLQDVRALLLDPVDLRGLPFLGSEGRSKWATPEFLPQRGTGILFLDELNAAPAMVQASCYQLVLDRKLGEYTLPEGWAIIAAGNRDSDRAVTTRMPTPLRNRFVHLEFEVCRSSEDLAQVVRPGANRFKTADATACRAGAVVYYAGPKQPR